MDKESIYLLQRIDCNCSDCYFLKRDVEQAKTQKGKAAPIFSGECTKFKKTVTFIPNICQLETQHCFIHRKDMVSKKAPI